jgi:cytochrome c biogenesis protein CcmG/thiol:disulfide interchange protein DsbE
VTDNEAHHDIERNLASVVPASDDAGGSDEAASGAARPGLTGPRRVARLVGRHKLGSAIVALIVLAVVVGVATGSLSGSKGASDSSGGDGQATTIVYSHPAPAPAFSLPALSGPGSAASTGQQVSLSQYQGKPLMLNFFASWCEPCQRETPLLASFYKASHGRVTILGVDGNDATGPATAFVKAKGVTYPVGVDPHLLIAGEYNIGGFPQTFFLNARHEVVYRVIGAVTSQELTRGEQLMGLAAS